MEEKKKIIGFQDLDVYQRAYKAALIINEKIILFLQKIRQYDLADQIGRSSKAIPALIAEGYAKRHQKHGFQKYLDDAMGECNETIVGLEQCRDLYGDFLDNRLCEQLIDLYDKSGRQLYNLSSAWSRFKKDDIRTLL